MLQTNLGEINDCATTEKLLVKRNDLRPAQRDWLAGNLRMLAAVRIAKFRKYWHDDFGQPEKERRWIEYLTRYAAPRRE